MADFPVMPTPWVTGDTPVALEFNLLCDAWDWYASSLPTCQAFATVPVTTATNTNVVVPLDGELMDNSGSGMHNPVGSTNTRIYAPITGTYEISAQVIWVPNVTGRRVCQIRTNSGGVSAGAALAQSFSPPSPAGVRSSAGIYQQHRVIFAGDYIELYAIQDSGGPLDTVGGQEATMMCMRLVTK